MKRKWPIIIIILLLILAGVGVFAFYRFQTKVHYNTDYVNGNSAGNLYNGGLFCEKDGTVYYRSSFTHKNKHMELSILRIQMMITNSIPWIPMETI